MARLMPVGADQALPLFYLSNFNNSSIFFLAVRFVEKSSSKSSGKYSLWSVLLFPEIASTISDSLDISLMSPLDISKWIGSRSSSSPGR